MVILLDATNSFPVALISRRSAACFDTPSAVSISKDKLNTGFGTAGIRRDLARVLPPLRFDFSELEGE
jgi:hypothetical protein